MAHVGQRYKELKPDLSDLFCLFVRIFRYQHVKRPLYSCATPTCHRQNFAVCATPTSHRQQFTVLVCYASFHSRILLLLSATKRELPEFGNRNLLAAYLKAAILLHTSSHIPYSTCTYTTQICIHVFLSSPTTKELKVQTSFVRTK